MELWFESSLTATNTNGTGTTVHLFHNGVEIDKLTTDSGLGIANFVSAMVGPGDIIDLALTPEGIDGNRADGS